MIPGLQFSSTFNLNHRDSIFPKGFIQTLSLNHFLSVSWSNSHDISVCSNQRHGFVRKDVCSAIHQVLFGFLLYVTSSGISTMEFWALKLLVLSFCFAGRLHYQLTWNDHKTLKALFLVPVCCLCFITALYLQCNCSLFLYLHSLYNQPNREESLPKSSYSLSFNGL